MHYGRVEQTYTVDDHGDIHIAHHDQTDNGYPDIEYAVRKL